MSTTNYADPAYLQKFLLSFADILAQKISLTYTNDYNNIDNVIRLIPSASNPRRLNFSEATEVAERQSHYFSCHPTPTNRSAIEIFADHTEEQAAALKTDAYAVKNYLYLFSERPAIPAPLTAPVTPPTAISTTKRYKIDLSKLNNDLFDKEKEFFISDMTITNKSKDIFTLRANYRIEITFNFSRFEDLTDDIIPAIDETGAEVNIQPIAIINMLNDQAGRPFSTEISDNNGLYLTQKLTLDPFNKDLIFSNTKRDFGKEFYRNFHMILEKHEFSLANENKVTYTPYKNILKASFVTYEADETDKPLASREIPSTNANIFKLLSRNSAFFNNNNVTFRNFLSRTNFGVVGPLAGIGGGTAVFPGGFLNFLSLEDFNEAFNNLNKLLKDDQLFVSCYYEFDRAKKKNPSTTGAFSSVTLNDVEAVKKRIKGTKNVINLFEQRLRLTLMNAIITNCDLFSIDVPNTQIKVFERNEFSSKIQKELTLGNVAIGASTGFMIGQGLLSIASFWPPTAIPAWVGRGLLIGGTLVGAGVAVNNAVNAASTPTVVTEGFDSIPLREAAKTFTVNKANLLTSWTNNLSKARINAINNVGDPSGQAGYSPTQVTKKFFDEFDSEIKSSFGTPIPDDTDTGDRTIRFILFKDIIKLINALVNTNDPNVYIIAGGKTSYDTAKQEYTFLNCLDIPIEFNFFIKFLKRNILERKNLAYSSEEFLKDAFEQLIKFDSGLIDSARQIPYNIRMNYSLHDSKKPEFIEIKNIAIDASANGKKHELLNTAKYEKFKKNFIRSKVFDIAQNSGDLVKVYTIGTEQEFFKVNFYNDYIDATQRDPSLKRNFNSKDFQKYFINKHGFPCIINPYIQYDSVSIKYDNNLKFARTDNSQLETGQILQQESRLKLPYKFTCDFEYYISFFLDVGSYIFVVPPGAPFNRQNKLGFGGMYVIDTSEIKFIFNTFKNPNAEKITSKVSLGGLHVTYADYVSPTTNSGSPSRATAPPTSICLAGANDPRIAPLLRRKFSGKVNPATGLAPNNASTINSDEGFFSDYLFGRPGGRIF